MLNADENLRRVANWGVDTAKPAFLRYPSAGNFPTNRFNQYLALLKQVDGKMAFRDEGNAPDPSIMLWAWGWAGDTRHIGVCWMDETPTNQIDTLDGYRGQSAGHQTAYKHIDENWYLFSDW